MATHTLPPSDFGNSELMNYVVRMVTPMRREFGCTLDVPHFLHDFAYAREILEKAYSSADPRLREYAAYLDLKMFGPRSGPAPAPSQTAPEPAAPVAPATPAAGGELSEDELRKRMLSKYRGGLR
jgi:hypothetical protein